MKQNQLVKPTVYPKYLCGVMSAALTVLWRLWVTFLRLSPCQDIFAVLLGVVL